MESGGGIGGAFSILFPFSWPTGFRFENHQRVMKVSLILCHPTQGSFNHAIAGTLADAFRAKGHEVRFHDLHAEHFDPVYGPDEGKRDAVLSPDISVHLEELESSDALVIVHPNYWSRPPAMLCGWVDRVLRAGRAYQFVPDGKGGAHPQGLLKLKFGLVITTSNTPQEKEQQFLGDPLEIHWKKVVFGLLGVSNVERRNFGPIIISTPDQRAGWLVEAKILAESFCQ